MSVQLVRLWLPIAICVVGIVLAIAYPDRLEAAILIVSAGLSVWLLNWLYRVGVSGEKERDAEDEARDYFAKHGRWPDE